MPVKGVGEEQRNILEQFRQFFNIFLLQNPAKYSWQEFQIQPT